MSATNSGTGALLVDASSARRLVAITPSDTTDLSAVGYVRALYVGGVGAVALIAYDDTAVVTLTAVPAGSILNIAVKRVMAATTATLIVGLI